MKRSQRRRPGAAKRSDTILSIDGTDLSAVSRLDASTLAHAAETAARVIRIATRIPAGWPIGLEARLYETPPADISTGVPSGRLRAHGVRYDASLRAEILNRPPSEYGVIGLFTALDDRPLEPEDVVKAVRTMGGAPVWRTGPATTYPFPSGHVTRFPHHDRAHPAFHDLVRSVGEKGPCALGIVRAARTYFETTLLHPLLDGNGRAARALFQCVLKVDLGMRAPLFPLGPFFEANKGLLLDAKYCWQLDGDADPLVRMLTNCVAARCTTWEAELA